jgi:quinol monooxygenase YgiN
VSVLSLERYMVAESSRSAFEPLLAEFLTVMRTQPGLLWADGGRTEDDDGYVLLSEWRTPGDLDAWQVTPATETWEESTDPLLVTDAMRRRFSPGA